MTDKERREINEFLAEWQDETPKHCLKKSKQGCNNCFEHKCIPDYCTNAMPVLEKFKELFFEATFEFTQSGTVEITAKYHFGQVNVVGNTIHEVICRCAVEYLKAQGVGR